MATKLRISTSKGDIIVRLYDETPIHRDNMTRLAKDGYYDGTLFHRVIRDFMIQGGDPDSRNAPKGKRLGTGGPDYTLPAEIVDGLFHKRGALCAARLGDEVNPARESSGSQFYIVWGEVYKAGQLQQLDRQMKQNQLAETFNALVAAHKAEIIDMRRNRDRVGLQALQERLTEEAKSAVKGREEGISPTQKEVYTTIGGTPFLDRQYTVFGEVETGLDVVEQIVNADTDNSDRPNADITMTVSVVEE